MKRTQSSQKPRLFVYFWESL